MIPKSAEISLRVLLFCTNPADRTRRAADLAAFSLREVGDENSLAEALRESGTDVLIVSGPRLPEIAEQPPFRPAIVWIAPADADGPADVILPADVLGSDLCLCVNLIGARTSLLRTLDSFDQRAEELSAKSRWRVSGLWHSRSEQFRLAVTDPLTGLANRRYMEQSLKVELDRCMSLGLPLSVCVLDLDHFKPINDQWGHRAGDQVLRQVARRLQQSTRGSDVVCRFGGDEFTVIAPESDHQSAARLAERLLAAIGRTPFVFDNDNQIARLSCSIGIATATADEANSAANLLHQADQAMFAAKRLGGNSVWPRFVQT